MIFLAIFYPNMNLGMMLVSRRIHGSYVSAHLPFEQMSEASTSTSDNIQPKPLFNPTYLHRAYSY